MTRSSGPGSNATQAVSQRQSARSPSLPPLLEDSSRDVVRLDRTFFERPVLRVARDLLGKRIIRSCRGKLLTGLIVETEAYKGPEDRASHAFGGRRTAAVEALYNHPGSLHVYFVYGMHWLLNFKAGKPGKPEGILIRGIIAQGRKPNAPVQSKTVLVSGPGRVTKYLKIDKSLYGENATASRRIWLEDSGIVIPARHIIRSPRVGIDYAGPYWTARPWRFRIAPVFLTARGYI